MIGNARLVRQSAQGENELPSSLLIFLNSENINTLTFREINSSNVGAWSLPLRGGQALGEWLLLFLVNFATMWQAGVSQTFPLGLWVAVLQTTAVYLAVCRFAKVTLVFS